MDVTTLADAVDHFSTKGYTGDFLAGRGGLREFYTDTTFRAEHLQIDDLYRFEGESDPGEESIVFALYDPAGGVRGTYVVAFGPNMDRLDAMVVPHLRDARARKT